ncbi:MAG: hypothetical protein ACREAA_08200 [Candidatus Polarisedimenticolia bacterium]
MKRLTVLLLCLITSSASFPGERGYEAGDVQHRVVMGPDEDGDLLVSVKVEVTNTTDEDMDVDLELQGCDRDGFELVELDLSGKVSARSSKVITDTDYISAEVLERIDHWNVE